MMRTQVAGAQSPRGHRPPGTADPTDDGFPIKAKGRSGGYGTAMARMTPAEATAVNILCSYIAGQSGQIPDEVARALETLASRANNRIQTGWDENAVRKQWPQAFPTTPPAPPAADSTA